ncbi:hypothetical protein C7S16_1048 [Burkholderia thailandensis]|uniref:Uncharacterized protein n=1 Tax=Burkholderia thailandensis TaxID=57975 RepID=A0AAW9D3S9_BURTH|nr:hypothetical protein [Burkholderia thailandensis]MDW9255489.1 hypothetical protein [Burkholderia thailandensis]
MAGNRIFERGGAGAFLESRLRAVISSLQSVRDVVGRTCASVAASGAPRIGGAELVRAVTPSLFVAARSAA